MHYGIRDCKGMFFVVEVGGCMNQESAVITL